VSSSSANEAAIFAEMSFSFASFSTIFVNID
jgi:hypothetical protein